MVQNIKALKSETPKNNEGKNEHESEITSKTKLSLQERGGGNCHWDEAFSQEK